MAAPVLELTDARLRYGDRELWSGLDLQVRAGEFLAVIGPNGTGKTSLLRAILGQVTLTSGRIELLGQPVGRGNDRIGYVPQQKPLDQGTPIRARDLVAFGVNGRRWGLPHLSPAERRRVDEALDAVGATAYAKAPVASLSGGEQQRVRIAQSVVGNPALLLCDEPLLSLDLAHQRAVSELIDEQRRRIDTAVVFVTHDVNPILGMVDRVLYLAGGQFRVGTPDEVLRSEVLSEMYGTTVDVFHSRGRIIVVGGPEGSEAHAHHIDEEKHA
ncbi:metal ABC transporter ATP-binding protein [Galbitalea soli]|uniref:ABC transporter ATP-binding protein n=1 Tax=Galbitalea soli TaxID=1268042 RepID=A0A7C9PNN8_9MICO|nr:ABC transporter ATP-binding protein [Galbitalea soli]NEM91792.1 ABC transporter ATP-binding protein [Galbitalea soli]NYJ29375.1 zinc/manganese transport system ATP-binding protein [Galbitalea soli]